MQLAERREQRQAKAVPSSSWAVPAAVGWMEQRATALHRSVPGEAQRGPPTATSSHSPPGGAPGRSLFLGLSATTTVKAHTLPATRRNINHEEIHSNGLSQPYSRTAGQRCGKAATGRRGWCARRCRAPAHTAIQTCLFRCSAALTPYLWKLYCPDHHHLNHHHHHQIAWRLAAPSCREAEAAW
ncbi:hypothetical protein O3P69_006666 [Scylla paramamosain]|uniref:Uncharacterized protein n=1 Tax=Scylla paramamosain TaxID=85552 RepID=A0AAW0U3V5_SCYPA